MKTPQHYIAEAERLLDEEFELRYDMDERTDADLNRCGEILSNKPRLIQEKALELQAADLAKEHERELIDFARYYQETCSELDDVPGGVSVSYQQILTQFRKEKGDD